MAEEFLENSDQHLQMTLAVTNTITHLMENKCKWMLHSQKYRLDRWKRPESKSCCSTIFSKISIKNVWHSTIWCGLLFTIQPVLSHLFSAFTLVGSSFFGLWRGETAQYLSWKIGSAKKKAKRPISHVIWDFSPVVWPFSDSESIYVLSLLTHSLPKNVGVWTRSHIKKKCFLPFQQSYNLTTEILSFFFQFSTNRITASTVKIAELCSDWLEEEARTVGIPLHCCTIIKRESRWPRLYHLPFNGAKSCPKSFFYNRAFSLTMLKEFRLTKVS